MPTYANHAWIIDRDYTEHTDDHEPRFNETTKQFEHSTPKAFDTVDVMGPRSAHPKAIADLKAGKGVAFQLWDDDGIRYYSGRFFETLDDEGYDSVDEDDWTEAGPLDDYGAPNAGCTSMTIKNCQPFVG